MRLHRLSLQAFGPFAARQEIDFDRLAQSQLFLLEGPTGAGKSTILDAITFALYGALAGHDTATDRLHSHFADPATAPEVTLEFSANGRRYRVTRSPEHERPKLRGDGMLKERPSAHLERLDDGQWATQATQAREAGVILAEVLGLTREQFTQVVLLPQGEFATFLRADDDERRKVLSRLFGTGLYDRVTQSLDDQRKAARAAVAAAKTLRGEALAAAREAAGETSGDGEAGAPAEHDDSAEYARTRAEALAQSQTAAQAAVAATHIAVLAAQQHRDAAAVAAERAERLRSARAALAAHEETAAIRTAWEKERAHALAAAPVRPLLAQVTEARDLVADAQARLRDAIDEPTEAEERGEGAESRRAAAAAARAAAAALEPLVAREQALGELRAQAAAAAQEADAAQTALAGALARQTALPGLLAEARLAHAEAQQAAAGLPGAQQRAAALATQHAAARRAELRLDELTAADSARRLAVEAHQAAVDEHQRLQDARLAGIAAELAASLSPGEPCAVCGATEHPAPARPGPAAVNVAEVQRARERRDTAEAARAAAEEHWAALDGRQQHDLAVAAGRSADELVGELDEARTLVDGGAAALGGLDELAARVGSLVAAEAAAAGAVLAATTAEASARTRSEQAQAALAAEERDLAAAREGRPSVRARQAEWIGLADRDDRAAEALAALAQAESAWGARRAHAGAEAVAAGFGDAEAARQALRDAGQLAGLSEQIETWDADHVRLKAAADDPDLADLDPAQADGLRAIADEAQRETVAAHQRWKDALAVQTTADERVARFADRARELLDADAALERARAEARPLERLAGLAKGTEGHRRVALTTYVLRLWFEKVVQAANLRLQAMSAGRYSLERVDGVGSARERSGLTLKVVDAHTGQSRSEKSLSGGETFYTSLALALGVADVVSTEAGGIALDTLFIDEGFGSLDTETLDQVMGVIEALREGGRAVGIVSHVAELKERVPERLAVRRDAEGGPSWVEVIA
jgi:exonuclease SbcC